LEFRDKDVDDVQRKADFAILTVLFASPVHPRCGGQEEL
jgi:hypothetical protein